MSFKKFEQNQAIQGGLRIGTCLLKKKPGIWKVWKADGVFIMYLHFGMKKWF
jgi:hypothetical protein